MSTFCSCRTLILLSFGFGWMYCSSTFCCLMFGTWNRLSFSITCSPVRVFACSAMLFRCVVTPAHSVRFRRCRLLWMRLAEEMKNKGPDKGKDKIEGKEPKDSEAKAAGAAQDGDQQQQQLSEREKKVSPEILALLKSKKHVPVCDVCSCMCVFSFAALVAMCFHSQLRFHCVCVCAEALMCSRPVIPHSNQNGTRAV